MNFRKFLYITVLVSAIASCKKDEDTPVTPGLDGYLRIKGLPEFIAPGETITLKPEGALHPEGKDAVGYYWKVIPTMTQYDTTRYTNGLDKPNDSGVKSDGSFTHTFSDTLKTYTVYCYAFASGYTGLSALSYTTAVAPGYNGSIRGINYKSIAKDSIAVRHMQYYYNQIGEQTWTLNNMAVREGIPFRNAEVMSEIFGRYYNFDDARSACDSLTAASGDTWVVPSQADWDKLHDHIAASTGEGKEYGKSVLAAVAANADFNGTPFWEFWPEEVGDITNSSNFSALSTGYANVKAGSFHGDFEYAVFWTSDSASDTEGYYKYFICDQPGIFTGKGNKESFGASVRCIRK